MEDDRISRLLLTLPENVILHVLYKIPVVELVRLRMSCSFLSKLIEKNGRFFSKRVGLGACCSISCSSGGMSLLYKLGSHPITTDLHTLFSGVPISLLHLATTGQEFADNAWENFLTSLSNFPLHCLSAYFNEVPPEIGVRVTDSIHCHEITCNFYSAYRARILSELSKARNRSKFDVRISVDIPNLASFDISKDFLFLTAKNISVSTFQNLVFAIYNSPNTGTIKRMTLNFRSEEKERMPFIGLSSPPFKVLFDGSRLPETRRTPRSPYFIRLMELRDKFLVIIEMKSLIFTTEFTKERLIFLNKNMADVFDFVIEFLVLEDVPSSAFQKFLNGDEDLQENCIRELYLKYANRSHYENIPKVGSLKIPDASHDARYDRPTFNLLITKVE